MKDGGIIKKILGRHGISILAHEKVAKAITSMEEMLLRCHQGAILLDEASREDNGQCGECGSVVHKGKRIRTCRCCQQIICRDCLKQPCIYVELHCLQSSRVSDAATQDKLRDNLANAEHVLDGLDTDDKEEKNNTSQSSCFETIDENTAMAAGCSESNVT